MSFQNGQGYIKSPLYTVNFKVFSSLDMLNMEDRDRQLRLNNVYYNIYMYHGSAPRSSVSV